MTQKAASYSGNTGCPGKMDLPRRRGLAPGSRPRLPALSTPQISSLALCFISSWKGAFFPRAATCDVTVTLTATVENAALSLYFPARRLSPHPRPRAVCIPVFGKGVLLMGGTVGRGFLRLVFWVCTCQVSGPELMLLEHLPGLRGWESVQEGAGSRQPMALL